MKLILGFLLLFMHPPGQIEPNDQKQKPLFSFGIVADVQYRDADAAGSRFYRDSRQRLEEAYKTFKEDTVDFAVNLGDIIDGDFESYAPVMDIIRSSGIKTYHVTGNHDYAVESKLKKKLPVLSGSKKGYYSFVSGGFRFIFLNGNEISTYASSAGKEINKGTAYLNRLKAAGEINSVEWNGGIGRNQLEWFEKELKEANAENQKVFIFCHFPIFPMNIHNLLNYNDVLEILKKYSNIVAWFNGHNHAGNYGNFNMIHFVTFRGMVETATSGSYSIVDVYSNKIWIRGFGREKSLILAY
jgi:3',5'-cyclic AMP phosphodiesterase CpdA